MRTVELYTIPTCPYSKMARELLARHRVPFTEHDVSTDLAARARMVELSHQRGVPVVDLGEEVFVGFNRAELERALGVR